MTLKEAVDSGKYLRRESWPDATCWLYVMDNELHYQEDGMECQLDLEDAIATNWEVSEQGFVL